MTQSIETIALHTTPGVPEFLEPEIALVAAGVRHTAALRPRVRPRRLCRRHPQQHMARIIDDMQACEAWMLKSEIRTA